MYVKAQPQSNYIICFIEMPDMMTLQMMTTCEEVLYIIAESCNAYRQIGTILLQDRRGTQVENLEDDCRGTSNVIMRKIYKRWIKENEHHTWEALTKCFRDCRLNSLANRIEQHFRFPSRPFSNEGTISHTHVIIQANEKFDPYIHSYSHPS